ncbi:MAG: ribosome maturation factor RimM [Gammaproteobacteria bacterium]
MNTSVSSKEASRASFVVVGRLGKSYGLEGWIHVHSFTDPLDNLLQYDPWYWQMANTWEIMPITAMRWHNDGVMIQMSDLIANREAIQSVTGQNIAICRTQLPPLPDGEYYWCDLEGLTVINRQELVLGKVDHILNVGAGDLLVVKKDKNTFMIPQLPQYVDTIDVKEGIIRVDWEVEWCHDPK